MFRKIILSLFLCIMMLVGYLNINGKGTDGMPIGIYVNEKEIATDVSPYIKNGTTFVPIRAICNAMRIDNIIWNGREKTVTVKAHNEIQFTIGEKYAYINGQRYNLSAPSALVDGRAMIPVRLFTEAYGADVSWDSTLYCVDISIDGLNVPNSSVVEGRTKDDVLWLSRIVEAESAGEPENGQLAVANVVLNRVASKDYPNTIYGVIFDTNYGVQFQPVVNGTIYNTPSKKAVHSSKRALAGENNVGNCMFFLNEAKAESFWIVNNREYYTTIENHSFYI